MVFSGCQKGGAIKLAFILTGYIGKAVLGVNGLGKSGYILGKESYDTMIDVEKMGGQVRDLNDEFAGAEFRDEKTKLMFAYDYDGKHCVRVFGSGFKPALYKELKQCGVQLCEHVMVTGLL